MDTRGYYSTTLSSILMMMETNVWCFKKRVVLMGDMGRLDDGKSNNLRTRTECFQGCTDTKKTSTNIIQ